MTFTDDFLYAFGHSMLYEVGPFWDMADPDVINGLCATREQRRKVGYVNVAGDRGGLTKYGIAQNANPEIDVNSLDLNAAMQIYYDKYWLVCKCDALPFPLQIMHFDAGVNHGPSRAAKMLQQAVGVEADGVIGPRTIAKIAEADQEQLIKDLAEIRTNRFHRIVENDPSQSKFLNGWLRRSNEVFEYTLDKYHIRNE